MKTTVFAGSFIHTPNVMALTHPYRHRHMQIKGKFTQILRTTASIRINLILSESIVIGLHRRR